MSELSEKVTSNGAAPDVGIAVKSAKGAPEALITECVWKTTEPSETMMDPVTVTIWPQLSAIVKVTGYNPDKFG